ncbi:MAG TPA: lantibiotic dehydratase [Micromonosporaceae bacterium]|nr:lantibiotic dehydratase [Micromonosporaceae bacterium]
MSLGSGRLALGSTGWWVWQNFALRSTGFPLGDLTDKLAFDANDDESDPLTSLRRALELANDDRFKMALLWQNPSIVENVLLPLSRRFGEMEAGTATDTKKDRQRLRRRERAIASYLQRYYTRNETIGFFGPITWGRFADQRSHVSVEAQESLTDQQTVWFEDWAIERLGLEFARDPAIRRHLPPVLALGVARLGRTVMAAGARPQRLTGPEAAVLDLVDGKRSGAAISAILGDERGVTAILDALVDRGIVSWGFSIPVDPHSEQVLLQQLHELPDLPAVQAARGVVTELISARDLVAAATTAAELAAAFDKADQCYAAGTHGAPRRTADVATRGRRLLVAQSHRAVDVAVGPAVLAELAGPLDLVLASARWFCWQIGELATERLQSAHRALAATYGPDGVRLDALLSGALLDFVQDESNAAPIQDELVRRWTAVLRLDTDARESKFTTAELAEAVADNFASPSPTWYAGRHHSPDVMIAASDVEAIERGDYRFVLGEVHTGLVTCDSASINGFAPAPDAILRPAEAALADGPERYVPLYPRGIAGLTSRFYPTPETFSERYHYLSFGTIRGERVSPAGRRVELASVKVVHGPTGLEAEFPDSTRQPILVVCGEFLSLLTMQTFKMMPKWAHTPRVAVDRLVIAREAWQIPASEFAIASNRADPDPVGRVRNIARRYGLPRHCFWRVRPGAKPIYLDLRSPMLVRLLANTVRSMDESTHIGFAEMLPGPDQLWLTDGQGRRYTSELRLTVAEAERTNASAPLARTGG